MENFVPRGNISYTRFLEYVELGKIEGITIKEDNVTATYNAVGGGSGTVRLINTDPNLFTFL
jgi:translation elongation factor EF-4